jgi:hypothetical protein
VAAAPKNPSPAVPKVEYPPILKHDHTKAKFAASIPVWDGKPPHGMRSKDFAKLTALLIELGFCKNEAGAKAYLEKLIAQPHTEWVKFLQKAIDADHGSNVTRLIFKKIFTSEIRSSLVDLNQYFLFNSIEKGNLNMVRCFVNDCGANVEAVDQFSGNTPLQHAIEKGNLDMVRCLVQDCGANVDGVNEFFGNTPLKHAIDKGNLNAVRYLVQDCGADVETPYLYAKLLKYAILKGNADIIRCLVQDGRANVEEVDQFGHTPLKNAIFGGKLEASIFLMEQLLEKDNSTNPEWLKRMIFDPVFDKDSEFFTEGNNEEKKYFRIELIKHLLLREVLFPAQYAEDPLILKAHKKLFKERKRKPSSKV